MLQLRVGKSRGEFMFVPKNLEKKRFASLIFYQMCWLVGMLVCWLVVLVCYHLKCFSKSDNCACEWYGQIYCEGDVVEVEITSSYHHTLM